MTNRITRPTALRLRRDARRRSVDTQARFTSGRVCELLARHVGNPVSSAELARFTRQLATLLKAGVALLHAFDMLAQSTSNPNLRRLLLALKQAIAAGSGLADALRKHPRYFDALYCNLIAVGEHAGSLDTTLEQVANLQEKRQALQARVKKAMTYPVLVLLVGLGVSAVLLLKVVPQFQSLFAGFDAQLPLFTRQVIAVSDWLIDYTGGLLLLAGGGLLAGHWAWRRKPAFNLWALRHALRLPLAGPLLQQVALARFARTLATSFAAGVPLVEALGSVAAACGNPLYEHAVHRLRQEVANGLPLSTAMNACELFPNLAVQLCAVGETSGRLDDMLDKTASHYENTIDQMLDNLASLLEPLIVSILGVLVGGLVIAMYLPIFQLGDVI